MRNVFYSFFASLYCVIPISAEAQVKEGREAEGKSLKAVCRSVRELNSSEIYKSIASKHIRDRRANSTSFIIRRGTQAPNLRCLRVYDRNGTLVHSLGKYNPSGSAYSARYYGGTGCGDDRRPSAVARKAKANTGRAVVYVKVSESQCVRVADPRRCYNSVACR